jgi:hypothetical protein
LKAASQDLELDDPEALDIPGTMKDHKKTDDLADEPMRDSRKWKGKEKRKKRSKEGAPHRGGGSPVKSKIDSTKGTINKVDGSGNRAVHGSGNGSGKGSGNGSGNNSGNGGGGSGNGSGGNGSGGNGSGGNGPDGSDDFVDPRLTSFNLTDCDSFSNDWYVGGDIENAVASFLGSTVYLQRIANPLLLCIFRLLDLAQSCQTINGELQNCQCFTAGWLLDQGALTCATIDQRFMNPPACPMSCPVCEVSTE